MVLKQMTARKKQIQYDELLEHFGVRIAESLQKAEILIKTNKKAGNKSIIEFISTLPCKTV